MRIDSATFGLPTFRASIPRPARVLQGGSKTARVILGNAKYLGELNIATTSLESEAERLRQDGATAIFLAIDNKLAGVIAIADPIKKSTPDALKALIADGIRIVMLTGDNRTTANAVARRLGITEVEAEVLPDQKSAIVEKLRKDGRVVAMAGDGVNDAPALAAAEVGIAMGTGTDVAIESAGVTLLKGDLTGIVRARRLSHATMNNIRQNLFLHSSTIQPVCRSRRGCCIRSSDLFRPSWRHFDGYVFRECHRQCVALKTRSTW